MNLSSWMCGEHEIGCYTINKKKLLKNWIEFLHISDDNTFFTIIFITKMKTFIQENKNSLKKILINICFISMLKCSIFYMPNFYFSLILNVSLKKITYTAISS